MFCLSFEDILRICGASFLAFHDLRQRQSVISQMLRRHLRTQVNTIDDIYDLEVWEAADHHTFLGWTGSKLGWLSSIGERY